MAALSCLLGVGVLAQHFQHVAQPRPGASFQQKDFRVLTLLLEQLLELEPGGLEQLPPHPFHLRDVGQVDVADVAEHRLGCFVSIAIILHGECPLVLGTGAFPFEGNRAGRQAQDGRNQERGRAGHRGLVAACKPPQPREPGIAIGRDGLIGHPVLDVVAQRLGRGITVAWLQGHRLQHDALERSGHRGFDRRGGESLP